MWLQTEQPDRLVLVIEGSGTLSKEDIHVDIRITASGVVRWRYLHHRLYDRPIHSVPWEKGEEVRRDRLSRVLFQEIQAKVYEEITDLLIRIESDDKPNSPVDPPPGFDRRGMLGLLLTGRISSMIEPRLEEINRYKKQPIPIGIAQSVQAVRTRAGMNQRDFARSVGAGLQTIVNMENGTRSATPSTLRQIAIMARRHKEWKAADFLESQARIADSYINQKGGHR